MDGGRPGEGSEAAVGSGHQVLAADQTRVPDQPLSHELRMLDVVGGRVKDAWDDDLALWELDLLEYVPFVLVARVGALERQAHGFGLEHVGHDEPQRHVSMMRALVVAPAQVK